MFRCHRTMTGRDFLLPVLLLLGLFLRALYLFQLHRTFFPQVILQSPSFDQYRFMQVAGPLYHGHWLGSEVTRFSPAYSYLIALIDRIGGTLSSYPVFIFQAVVGTAAIYVFYRTAVLLFESRLAGLTAALLAACYAPFIFYEGTLLRASLIAYANLAGFYFLLKALKEEKRSYYGYAGLMIGLSMVLRPNALPVFILPYLLAAVKRPWRRKIGACGLFLAGVIVCVTPLALRNRALGKDVLISFQGPSTFWIGNTYDSYGIGLPRSPLRDRLANEAGGSIVKTAEILAREIHRHPVAYRNLYLRKIMMFFNAYEIPANLSFDFFRREHTALQIAFADFWMVLALAILGAAAGASRRVPYRGLLILFCAVLSVSVILFHVQGRYRIPAVPFFILFAACGVDEIGRSWRERNRKRTVLLAALLTGATLLVRPNTFVMNTYFDGGIRSEDYFNGAVVSLEQYLGTAGRRPENVRKACLRESLADMRKAMRPMGDKPRNAYERECFFVMARILAASGRREKGWVYWKRAHDMR